MSVPNPFGDDRDEAVRFQKFLGDATLPRIVRLTMPVFAPDDQRNPQLVGSSIVLSAGGARFLVTASHTLKDWPAPAINVGDELIALTGVRSVLHTNGADPGSDEDRADISVIRLGDPLASRIHDENLVAFADLDFTAPAIGRDPFILCGFPWRRNRKGLVGDQFTAMAYTLLMHDAEQALYDSVRAESAASLVLPFEKEDVWDLGKQVEAPDLEGISGGGLWRVPINDEALSDTRLAAFAIEQHPKGAHRYVLATRLQPVLQGIHRLNPDLRAAIESEYGEVVA